MWWVRSFFILIYVLGCSDEPKPSPSNSSFTNQDKKPVVGIESKDKSSAEKFSLLDPLQAHSILKSIEVVEPDYYPGIKIPRLEFEHDAADFVQVLRCAKSYTLTNKLGNPITSVLGTPQQSQDLKFAWHAARQDSRKCKLAGAKVAITTYDDIAAPSGEYYYVANPCIVSERSIVKQEDCSYALQVSSSVVVEAGISEQLRQMQQEISDLYSVVQAHAVNAKHLAEKIVRALDACENMIATDRVIMGQKRGLTSLAIGIGIAMIVTPVFGPNIGVMIGMMGGSMGAELLHSMITKMPYDIVNECVDPTVVATTAAERAAIKKDSSRTAEEHMVGTYEEEFQVQALSRAFLELVGEQGVMRRDADRLSKLLEEYQQLDTNLISLDYAIIKASQFGVELDFGTPPVASPFQFP